MKKIIKWAIVGVIVIFGLGMCNAFLSDDVEAPVVQEQKADNKVEPQKEEQDDMTVSQKNAVRSAESYLAVLPFSKSGLIEQLEYEGFSTEDATFAVEHIDVDWKEQAVKSAKQYLDTMPFSRDGLIEQLKFEGFTHDEAVYGVDAVGL